MHYWCVVFGLGAPANGPLRVAAQAKQKKRKKSGHEAYSALELLVNNGATEQLSSRACPSKPSLCVQHAVVVNIDECSNEHAPRSTIATSADPFHVRFAAPRMHANVATDPTQHADKSDDDSDDRLVGMTAFEARTTRCFPDAHTHARRTTRARAACRTSSFLIAAHLKARIPQCRSLSNNMPRKHAQPRHRHGQQATSGIL